VGCCHRDVYEDNARRLNSAAAGSETHSEEYVKSRQCWKRRKSYSIKPQNLNLVEYKNLSLNKLEDNLEITGFNMEDLRLCLLDARTIPTN
jgi:hypothetical protein